MKKLLFAILFALSTNAIADYSPSKNPYQKPLFLQFLLPTRLFILANVNNITSLDGETGDGSTTIHYGDSYITVYSYVTYMNGLLNPAPYKCTGIGCDKTKVNYFIPITRASQDTDNNFIELININNIYLITMNATTGGSFIYNKDGTTIEIEEDFSKIKLLIQGSS